MAKINIEIDTEEKTMNIALDGSLIPNVSDVSIYNENYYSADKKPEYVIRFSTYEKENYVIKSTTYMSAASESAKAAINNGDAIPCKKNPSLVMQKNSNMISNALAKILGEKNVQ